ncbi:hypothetical protein [Haloparvum sp. PAK95]|uniref:hypothetical protein n=1 Tax=Haloparvum sp. PAK95 TaxID=3418962 RepID=UPI003D2EA0D5
MITLPGDVVRRYPRFSLYNSPYPAHDSGHAIDLYPESNAGLSPVSGVVRDTRTVGCPDRPYAVNHDHLIILDVDDEWANEAGVDRDLVARILHVDPVVESGDSVAVGDSLGPMIRSGFFGQWVDNHVHLGFRDADTNPYRASGSLPVGVDVDVRPLAWDGTGVVREVGETYALLDAPTHPEPTAAYAAIASDGGVPLDGGLAHYAGGGALGGADGTVSLFGQALGEAESRNLAWNDVDVLANGTRITGLSLFASRDDAFGAKLVCPDEEFGVGEEVVVDVVPSDAPIKLGVGR